MLRRVSLPACAEFVVEHRVKKWRMRPRRWRETARPVGLGLPARLRPGDDRAAGDQERSSSTSGAILPLAEIDDHLIHETMREAGKRGVPGLGRRNHEGVAMRASGRWMPRSRCSSLGSSENGKSRAIRALTWSGPARRRRANAHWFPSSKYYLFWRACDAVGEPFAKRYSSCYCCWAHGLTSLAGMRRDELRDDRGTSRAVERKITDHTCCRCRQQRRRSSQPCRAINRLSFRPTGARRRADGLGRSANSTRRCSARARRGQRPPGANPMPVTLAAFRLHDFRRTFWLD